MHELKLSWLPFPVRSTNAFELSRQVVWMSTVGGPLSFAGDADAAPRTAPRIMAAVRAIFDLVDMAAPPVRALVHHVRNGRGTAELRRGTTPPPCSLT